MRIAVVNEKSIVINIIEAPMIYADNQKPCYDWTELREPYTDVEPLEYARARYIKALKSTRDTLEVAPITTDKGVFDFDTKARDRLDIALKALAASGGSIAWTLANNTQVDVTSSDINNVLLAAAKRSNELHEKYRALKEQINACMDAESVSKVTWY